jgi:hypothetical protein
MSYAQVWGTSQKYFPDTPEKQVKMSDPPARLNT